MDSEAYKLLEEFWQVDEDIVFRDSDYCLKRRHISTMPGGQNDNEGAEAPLDETVAELVARETNQLRREHNDSLSAQAGINRTLLDVQRELNTFQENTLQHLFLFLQNGQFSI